MSAYLHLARVLWDQVPALNAGTVPKVPVVLQSFHPLSETPNTHLASTLQILPSGATSAATTWHAWLQQSDSVLNTVHSLATAVMPSFAADRRYQDQDLVLGISLVMNPPISP